MKITKIALAVSIALSGSTLVYAANGNLAVQRVINSQGTATNAKACIVMSNDLTGTADTVAPYVDVKNLETGITTKSGVVLDGRSICLTDLEYGTNYEISLKKGLTVSGATLNSDYSTKFKTPDGSSYFTLLPGNLISSQGEHQVAIETVNYPEYKVMLFRESKDDLTSYWDWSNFYDSDYLYSILSGIREHSTFVGSKNFTVKGEKNKKQISFVNLDDFAGKLPSGLYKIVVTSAKAPDCDKSLTCLDQYDSGEGSFPVALKRIVISDLGVTAYQGSSFVDVAVRSLASGKPISGAKASLISHSNEVLATVTTDDNGYAKFSYESMSGTNSREPLLVKVVKNDDFYAVDLRKGSLSFDDVDFTYLSNTVNPHYNVYSYFNRSMVRPGEKVFYEAIVRNQQLSAADLKTLKLMIYRPGGVLFREVTLNNPRAGAFGYEFEFDKNSSEGSWRFDLGFDQNNVISTNKVNVSSFVPDSIETKLSFDKEIVTLKDALTISTKYLYGAPAGGISISGNLYVYPDHHPVAKYKDYYFGPDSDKDYQVRGSYDYAPGLTGSDGLHTYTFSGIKTYDYPSRLEFGVNFTDPNSQVTRKEISTKLEFVGPMIGVKIEGDKVNLRQQKLHVILSDQQGKLYTGKVNYRLYRQDVSYQYIYKDGVWSYFRNVSRTPVKAGDVDVKDDLSTVINQELDFGNYILELEGAGAVATTTTFYAGSKAFQDPSRPERIELFTNQKTYKAGDKLEIEFDSPYDGYADLMIDSSNDLFHFEVKKGHNRVDTKLPSSFVKGGYALLSTYASEANKYLGAVRSVGIAYLTFSDDDKLLKVSSDLPESVKPNTGLDINIKVDGADSDTYVTATLIDEGILKVSKQKPSQPENYIYNNRDFTTRVFDDYGYIMRSPSHTGQGYGDDDEGGSYVLSNITDNLMSYYTQDVKVNDGVATVHFDLKDLSSTAKLSVSAWSKDRLGSLDQTLVVKDNTVSKVNLPNYLHNGDVINASLLIYNLKQDSSGYTYTVTCSGAMSCNLSGKIDVKAGQESSIPLDVKAESVGEGFVDIKVEGPDYNFATRKSYEVLTPYAHMTENKIAVLKGSEQKNIALNSIFDNSALATISYGKLPVSDAKAIVKELMGTSLYGSIDNAAAGLAALDLLATLEKDPNADKEYINTLADYIRARVSAVSMFLGSNCDYLNESFFQDGENRYAFAYDSIFLVKASRAGFNVTNKLVDQLYTALQRQLTSEHDNVTALTLSSLMLMGENVLSNAIYSFDNMQGKTEKPLEALALYAEIFKAYGDETRMNIALKEGQKIASDVFKKLSNNEKTAAQILAKYASISKALPYGVNTYAHDLLSLIRAKVRCGSSDGLDELFSYLSAEITDAPAVKAVLVELSSLPEAKASVTQDGIKVSSNNIAVANPGAEPAVASISVSGDTIAQSFTPVVNVYQEFYGADGKEIRGPVNIKLGEDLLVVQRIVFGAEYSGIYNYNVKLPANTSFVKFMDNNSLAKKYPSLKNLKLNYSFRTAGDTGIYFSDSVYKSKSIVLAYVIKGSHKGTSAPLMNKGSLKKAVNVMFNYYRPDQSITVK